MKITWKLLLAAVIALTPLLAQAGAVELLHQFLQTTQTMKADFTQSVVSNSGRKPMQSSGTVAISRPGKLRWEIIKPAPQLIVGDGETVWIYDIELQQVTKRSVGKAIGGSPAALLAGRNDLEKNFALSEAGEADGMNWVEATPKSSDSGFESVRLGFAGADLKAMDLHDSFGQTTHIRFSKLQRNPALPASNFKFTPPAGVDVVGE